LGGIWVCSSLLVSDGFPARERVCVGQVDGSER
jgi:hypothetical protein